MPWHQDGEYVRLTFALDDILAGPGDSLPNMPLALRYGGSYSGIHTYWSRSGVQFSLPRSLLETAVLERPLQVVYGTPVETNTTPVESEDDDITLALDILAAD